MTRKKLLLLGALYFSQGLPFGFFVQALPALLRKAGMSLPAIGLSSLLVLPWAIKFLWAPFVDRWHVSALGRRRSWILPLQALTVFTMAGLAWLDPSQDVALLMAAFLIANVLAATQDVATDGLAVELLEPAERGLGNGVQVAGYRVGMIIGGGALLVAYEYVGWRGTFLTMAALLAIATFPILRHREPPREQPAPQSGALRAFVSRPGAVGWLLFLLIYKSGDALGSGMLRPMLVDQELSLADIGWLLGALGFGAGLVGALLGGLLVGRFGRVRALVVFGVLQALAVASYALPAMGWIDRPTLWSAVIADHLAGGMATVALFTMMMDACGSDDEGSDYTLQACVVVIATVGAAALSGFSAELLGYVNHFVLGGALSCTAALLVLPIAARGGFAIFR